MGEGGTNDVTLEDDGEFQECAEVTVIQKSERTLCHSVTCLKGAGEMA